MSSFADEIIGPVWVVACVGWVLLGFTAKRTRVWVPSTEQAVHYLVTAAGMLVFMSPSLRWPLGHEQVIPRTDVTASIGLALLAAGIAFGYWARAILGRNWSGLVTLKEDHQLIRRGPYNLVRHPIYTGILTALLGTTLALGQLRHVIGWAIVAVGLWLKSRVEERWLLREFGSAYETYRKEVPALVPLRFGSSR